MRYFLIFFILLFVSCKTHEKSLTAQEIIDNSIRNSGTHKVSNSEISFDFRDKHYSAIRKIGKFELSRKFDSIRDVLNNKGFERFLHGESLNINDKLISKYSNAINSVHYFSILPFGLNDAAVKKRLLNSTIINKKAYYKIEITFSENGGGQDFEDVFIYWIGKNDFLIDYLAYSFHTNGGGMRFRVLKEHCTIEGIRFVDYYNYKPKIKTTPLIELDKAFENKQLEKVSEIILEDISVKILD
ncbi:MAG: deoxyribose-phosphate aldolase [Polaribacter sp.]|nr:deoxyribose-phosphate aldolase [Polaribacter sp.]